MPKPLRPPSSSTSSFLPQSPLFQNLSAPPKPATMAAKAANFAAFFSAHFFPHLRPFRPKLCCLFVFIPFFVVLAILAHHLAKLDVTMGTVAGHNLEPTPWHRFEPKQLDDGYSKIVKCSLLSSCTTFLDWTRFGGRRRRKSGWGSLPECPFFFRWIHEDLAPWAESGITAEDVAAAKEHAAMRVVVIDGRLFADLYYACVESRVVFTLWGFLQLLRRYPGNVPNVDLMFDCMDRPVIQRWEAQRRPPPPLFRYSTTPRHYDIPFPDWSFWGWYVFSAISATMSL